MGVSLFGLIAHLNPTVTLVVFVCLIVFLVLFETVLHHVEHAAHSAGYGELVNKLYKELTIMGIAGFGVLIAFTVFPLKHDDNYLAFEFAHITTFFIAIFLCLRAISVVYNSSVATAGLWKAHNLPAHELYDRHMAAVESWSSEGILYRYIGVFSPLRRYVEYTIIEEYFYATFCLSQAEFRFVDYLTRSYRMYAISLTDISPYSWFVVIFLAVLNYIRIVSIGSKGNACAGGQSVGHHDDHHDDDHRRLSGGDDEAEFYVETDCADYYMGYFLFCGGLLLLFVGAIAIVTWVSEKKLLHQAITRIVKGSSGKHVDYGLILKALSELEKFRNAVKERKMLTLLEGNNESVEEMGDISQRISSAPSLLDIDISELDSNVYHVCTLRNILQSVHHKKLEKQMIIAHMWEERLYHFSRVLTCRVRKEREGQEKRQRLLEMRRSKHERRGQYEKSIRSEKMTLQSPSKTGSNATSTIPTGVIDHTDSQRSVESSGTVLEDHTLLKENNDIFLYGSRSLYKRVIEIALMLFALYLSLWVTHFILIARETHFPATYMVISVVPIVGIFLITSYIQYHSNMLLAVTSLQNENAEWICEQDNIKNKTLPLLRKEIREIMSNEGATYTSMKKTIGEIFDLVNMDGDDKIVLSEFSTLLYTLDIHLVHSEVHVLFHYMDTDCSGYISLDELSELLWDDSSLISKNNESANSAAIKSSSKSKGEILQRITSEFMDINNTPPALQSSGGHAKVFPVETDEELGTG